MYRIWLGELSHELPPSTQFDGFDISDAQYPPQNWYGPNTRLQKLDIFKPLPKHLAGKYDVVNLRFFMTIAKDSDIGVLLRNLRGMLSRFFLFSVSSFLFFFSFFIFACPVRDEGRCDTTRTDKMWRDRARRLPSMGRARLAQQIPQNRQRD